MADPQDALLTCVGVVVCWDPTRNFTAKMLCGQLVPHLSWLMDLPSPRFRNLHLPGLTFQRFLPNWLAALPSSILIAPLLGWHLWWGYVSSHCLRERINECLCQYWLLIDTTRNYPPVGFYTTDHNSCKLMVQPAVHLLCSSLLKSMSDHFGCRDIM